MGGKLTWNDSVHCIRKSKENVNTCTELVLNVNQNMKAIKKYSLK